MSDKDKVAPSCPLTKPHDNKQLQTVVLSPEPSPTDYREAMQLADEVANEHLGSHMLISWYDADRDFESPQHPGECHLDSAAPGYVQ